MSQRAKVIDLYKTMLHLGKDWHQGYDTFRFKLHRAFLKNKDETDPAKVDNMIKHGKFVIKEIEALYMLKKYRTLKRRYH
ncbi:electron transfer flavoprotein regulatory factor orsai [Arctopsyche grandis]|uniref:electron transfer flavoprotein regulatory factor orsai n=1 Tax=Arctopsyche grandis TaxID=121162 RepID=UPI00406D71E8